MIIGLVLNALSHEVEVFDFIGPGDTSKNKGIFGELKFPLQLTSVFCFFMLINTSIENFGLYLIDKSYPDTSIKFRLRSGEKGVDSFHRPALEPLLKFSFDASSGMNTMRGMNQGVVIWDQKSCHKQRSSTMSVNDINMILHQK